MILRFFDIGSCFPCDYHPVLCGQKWLDALDDLDEQVDLILLESYRWRNIVVGRHCRREIGKTDRIRLR